MFEVILTKEIAKPMILNDYQSEWWLEYAVNARLDVNKEYRVVPSLGDLDVLITFLGNTGAVPPSFVYLTGCSVKEGLC